MLRELDGGGRVTLHLLDEAAPGSGLASWRSLMSEAAGNLPAFGSEAQAMLVHTSGTTGAPKDYTRSSANIHANVAGLVVERLGGDDERSPLQVPRHRASPTAIERQSAG